MPITGASQAPKVRGPNVQFYPTFQKSRVLLHSYVTIFWNPQSQGAVASMVFVDTRPLLGYYLTIFAPLMMVYLYISSHK